MFIAYNCEHEISPLTDKNIGRQYGDVLYCFPVRTGMNNSKDKMLNTRIVTRIKYIYLLTACPRRCIKY